MAWWPPTSQDNGAHPCPPTAWGLGPRSWGRRVQDKTGPSPQPRPRGGQKEAPSAPVPRPFRSPQQWRDGGGPGGLGSHVVSAGRGPCSRAPLPLWLLNLQSPSFQVLRLLFQSSVCPRSQEVTHFLVSQSAAWPKLRVSRKWCSKQALHSSSAAWICRSCYTMQLSRATWLPLLC